MLLIENVTSDTRQRQTLKLSDGTAFTMSLYFVPMQFGWFITDLVYQDFRLSGIRVCNSPNLLHQFRNQIPFGLACFSQGKREPMFQEDFSSKNSNLYVLTAEEANQYQEFIAGA